MQEFYYQQYSSTFWYLHMLTRMMAQLNLVSSTGQVFAAHSSHSELYTRPARFLSRSAALQALRILRARFSRPRHHCGRAKVGNVQQYRAKAERQHKDSGGQDSREALLNGWMNQHRRVVLASTDANKPGPAQRQSQQCACKVKSFDMVAEHANFASKHSAFMRCPDSGNATHSAKPSVVPCRDSRPLLELLR